MLEFNQIASFYPEAIRGFKKNILREYLQYKILEMIFESEFAGQLVFMGGTSLRIAYGNNRFSEDLDFDNFGLTAQEFEKIGEMIKKNLAMEGYSLEIRSVLKKAFHCYIGILHILFENGISPHRGEKLVIRLDTEPQGFDYQANRTILNKFDVFTGINIVPQETLLAQKIFAILNRKRTMGRDIFDAIFLFGRTKPDFDYLKLKVNISNMRELQELLLAKCEKLDFENLSRDVAPFLIKPGDSKKVLLFGEYIRGVR